MKHNPNSPDFWNKKIRSVKQIGDDDYITRDRINRIARIICNNSVVLDIGIGYGFLEAELTRLSRFLHIIGVDISREAVVRARRNFRGEFLVSRSNNLPFGNNCFDYVCLLEVLEHLYEDESKLSLLEAKRVLKRNGRLIVSVPLFDKVFFGHPSGHVRQYEPKTIFEELSKSGLEIVSLKYLFAFSSFYKIKSIISEVFHIKQPNNLIIVARKK